MTFSLQKTPGGRWTRRGHAPQLLLRMLDMDPLAIPQRDIGSADHLTRAISAAVQSAADRTDWDAYRDAESARPGVFDDGLGGIEWNSPYVRSIVDDGEAAEAYALASANAFYTQLTYRMMESESLEGGDDDVRIELDGQVLTGDDAFAHIKVMRAAAQHRRKEARPTWLE